MNCKPVPLIHHPILPHILKRIPHRLGLAEGDPERVVGVGVQHGTSRIRQLAGVADGLEGVEGVVAGGIGPRQ